MEKKYFPAERQRLLGASGMTSAWEVQPLPEQRLTTLGLGELDNQRPDECTSHALFHPLNERCCNCLMSVRA